MGSRGEHGPEHPLSQYDSLVVTGIGKIEPDDLVISCAPPPCTDVADHLNSLEGTSTKKCFLNEVASKSQRAKITSMEGGLLLDNKWSE